MNLERSLQLGDRLGGHLVTGHIDGTGTLIKRRDEGDWSQLHVSRAAAADCGRWSSKGSVAVDGVSLTLVDVETDRFSVALIPHTLANTTLGKLEVGDVGQYRNRPARQVRRAAARIARAGLPSSCRRRC